MNNIKAWIVYNNRPLSYPNIIVNFDSDYIPKRTSVLYQKNNNSTKQDTFTKILFMLKITCFFSYS